MNKLATAIMLASSASFAGTMGPAMSAPEYQFFVGATAGVGTNIGTTKITDGADAGDVTDGGFINQSGSNSFIGGGLIGVQKYFDNDVYLGLALNGLYNSLDSNMTEVYDINFNNVEQYINVTNHYQYGANVRLGKKLNHDMMSFTPYLLGGVEAGSFDLSLAIEDGVNNTLYTRKASKTLSGFQGGLGTLVHLTPHVMLGMEYAHTWFGKISATFNNNSVTHTVAQDQVLLSANYLF